MLTACSATDKSLTSPANPYTGTTWQIEDIDNGGIIDNSMITLHFADTARITGFTGCNRYFGTIHFNNNTVTVSGLGSTRRACAPALMNQEQRFLAALGRISQLEMARDTWLLARDKLGTQHLKMIQIEKDPTARPPVE